MEEKRPDYGKSIRDNLEALLHMPVTNEDDIAELSNYGIDSNSINNGMLVVLSLYKSAKKGDISAAKELLKLVGTTGDESAGDAPVYIINDLGEKDD